MMLNITFLFSRVEFIVIKNLLKMMRDSELTQCLIVLVFWSLID